MKIIHKQCVACVHSAKDISGTLVCIRKDPNTGSIIPPPNSCNVQRSYGKIMNFLCSIFTGYDLCGQEGKYYEEDRDSQS